MRHKHNIDLYNELRNQGLSWRQIAKKLNVKDHTTIAQWVDRNFNEIINITYTPKLK
jgi:IS30 family transposase